jgi:hypothetical protein
MTEFYDMLGEIDKAFRSINDQARSGEEARADELRGEYGEKLGYRKMLATRSKTLSNLRKQKDAVMRDREMSAGEKRAAIDELTVRMNELAKTTVEQAREGWQ